MAELLQIADGGTVSSRLNTRKYRNLILYAPASLSGVTTVKVSPKSAEESAATDYIALESGGSDVVLTAAKATPVVMAGAASILVESGTGPTGATEDIYVTGEFLNGRG